MRAAGGIVRVIITAVELNATYCNANMSILLVTPEEGLPKGQITKSRQCKLQFETHVKEEC